MLKQIIWSRQSLLKATSEITKKMEASCCICFFSLLTSCLAANYVMFPMFSRSHYLVIAKVGEELAARGHWVSWLNTISVKLEGYGMHMIITLNNWFYAAECTRTVWKARDKLKSYKIRLASKSCLQIKGGFAYVPILGGDICRRYRDLCC